MAVDLRIGGNWSGSLFSKGVSKLFFYAQSTSAVISGRFSKGAPARYSSAWAASGFSKKVCLHVDAGWLKLICEYGGRERSVLVAIPCGCRLLVSSRVTTYVYYL